MAVIKRQQHNLKLGNVLNNLLQCGTLCDVTIYCDDGQVNAHRLVLAASSAYFRSLFSRLTNTFHYPIIVLREMSIIDLKTIIQFIYHGEVNVPQNRVDSLIRCANYLQIDGMASSANSLNVVLASSSVAAATMSHQAILTSAAVAHPGSSATNNSILNNNQSTLSTLNNSTTNKLHTQYLPMATTQSAPSTGPATSTNYKQRGGHGSRSNQHHSNSNNNNTNTNNNNNNNNYNHSTTSSGTSDHTTNNSNIGKPKHPCTFCPKTFTHGFTLKRHIKALHSHTKTTIYCDVCSKSYSCKDSFMRHKKSSGHLQHAEFNHRSIDMN